MCPINCDVLTSFFLFFGLETEKTLLGFFSIVLLGTYNTGTPRVYPEPNPDDEDPISFPLRSLDQQLYDLKSATEKKPVNGIFGPTPLINQKKINFVKSFVPELYALGMPRCL